MALHFQRHRRKVSRRFMFIKKFRYWVQVTFYENNSGDQALLVSGAAEGQFSENAK